MTEGVRPTPCDTQGTQTEFMPFIEIRKIIRNRVSTFQVKYDTKRVGLKP
jgi:hypothetical protein